MMVGKPTDICIYLVFCPIYMGLQLFNVSKMTIKNDDQKRYGMTIISMTLITPLGG
jgi:hypothetical protein